MEDAYFRTKIQNFNLLLKFYSDLKEKRSIVTVDISSSIYILLTCNWKFSIYSMHEHDLYNLKMKMFLK